MHEVPALRVQAVQEAFEDGEMLREQHGVKGTGVSVNQHNLIAFLGLMESAAVRMARMHRAMLQSLQRAADGESEGEAAEATDEPVSPVVTGPIAPATKRKPMDIAKMRAEGTDMCTCVRVRVFVCSYVWSERAG